MVMRKMNSLNFQERPIVSAAHTQTHIKTNGSLVRSLASKLTLFRISTDTLLQLQIEAKRNRDAPANGIWYWDDDDK